MENRLQSTYGMSRQQYAELFVAQGGRCAICLAQPRTKALVVDHNHKTGEVRGLLCNRCNHRVLGASHENIAILKRAIDYLVQPPALQLWESPCIAPKRKQHKKLDNA